MITFTPLVSIHLGSITIVTHGLMVAIGFLVAFLLVVAAAKRRGLQVQFVENLAIICLVAGMVGARVAWILVEGRDLGLVEMLSVWHGGLSSHGGYVVGIAAGLGYAFYKKVEVTKYTDLMLPYLLVGWAIGRVGCLNAIGEWGWPLNHDSVLAFVMYGVRRYPTSLFESLADLVSFFVVLGLWKYTKFGKFSLVPSALTIFLFTLTRFLIDFLREYSPQYLIFSQTITASLVLLSLGVLVWRGIVYRKG